MIPDTPLFEHWQAFVPLLCDRLKCSNSPIANVISGLLPDLAHQSLEWADAPNLVPLSSCISTINDPHLRQLIGAMAPSLMWIKRGFFTSGNHINRAYVELIGPDGMLKHEQFRCGLYWQLAQTYYPKHRHKANELYHILSGSALWQTGDDDFILRKSGSSFEHLDGIDHATQTLDQDLLAFWAWRGDLSFNSYSMDTIRPS
jgi:hypothetical protein